MKPNNAWAVILSVTAALLLTGAALFYLLGLNPAEWKARFAEVFPPKPDVVIVDADSNETESPLSESLPEESVPVEPSAPEESLRDNETVIILTAAVSPYYIKSFDPDAYLASLDVPEEDDDGPVWVKIAASSTEEDLYIVIRTKDKKAAEGTFLLHLTDPDGNITDVKTNAKGSVYLNKLTPGRYKIEMEPVEGFQTAKSVSVTVKAPVKREVIEDISDIGELSDKDDEQEQGRENGSGITAGDLDDDESGKPSGNESSRPESESSTREESRESRQESTAESRAGESESQNESGSEEPRVIEYVYLYPVGPNGFLLFKDSGLESDVKPVEKDDILLYGTRSYKVLVEESEPESSAPESVFDSELSEYDGESSVKEPTYITVTERVELFNEDGTPNGIYDIERVDIATLVTGWQEIDGHTYYFNKKGQPVSGLKKMNGVMYYFSNTGRMADELGIDVSGYQGNINWQKVKDAGITFAIIRVAGRFGGDSKTHNAGDLYYDSKAEKNIKEARAAGIKIGIYFFSQAITAEEAVEEASVCLTYLVEKDANGQPVLDESGNPKMTALELPIFIDMESLNLSTGPGRANAMNRAQRTIVAQAFCDTCINSGYEAGIYANRSYYNSHLYYEQIKQYHIWYAFWTTTNKIPNEKFSYEIWQFDVTATKTIPGISAAVDMDAIFY